MKKLLASALVLVAGLSSFTASANLISNGSFEDNNVNAGSWRWFYAKDVNGWDGSNIEIWEKFLGVSAVDGVQFAELNSHANGDQQFNIYQTFATNVGEIYDLSFFYRARLSGNEAFEVSVKDTANNTFFSQLMTDHVVGKWSVFTAQFTAVSTQTMLMFSSITPHAGTVGNFLDNVVVKGTNSFRQSNVSEPATYLLGASVFLGLMLSRRRRQQSL